MVRLGLALAAPLLAFLASRLQRRANIPEHLLHHVAFQEDALIDVDSGRLLNQVLREMAADEMGLPTNVAADLKTAVRPLHRHVGEARPVEADGSCSHHLLVRDGNSSECILPQRIDVAKHYIMTGGPE
ncbi:folD, partial [Symbiodinium microadriaticum]